jgi:hypothetical protein
LVDLLHIYLLELAKLNLCFLDLFVLFLDDKITVVPEPVHIRVQTDDLAEHRARLANHIFSGQARGRMIIHNLVFTLQLLSGHLVSAEPRKPRVLRLYFCSRSKRKIPADVVAADSTLQAPGN